MSSKRSRSNTFYDDDDNLMNSDLYSTLSEANNYFRDENPDMKNLNEDKKTYYALFNKIKDIMKNINENNKNINDFSRGAFPIIQEINVFINEIFTYIDFLQSTLSSINLEPEEKDKFIKEINKANSLLLRLFDETNRVESDQLPTILNELKIIKNKLQEKVQELNNYKTFGQNGGRRYRGTKKRSSRRTKKSVRSKKRRSTRRHRKR